MDQINTIKELCDNYKIPYSSLINGIKYININQIKSIDDIYYILPLIMDGKGIPNNNKWEYKQFIEKYNNYYNFFNDLLQLCSIKNNNPNMSIYLTYLCCDPVNKLKSDMQHIILIYNQVKSILSEIIDKDNILLNWYTNSFLQGFYIKFNDFLLQKDYLNKQDLMVMLDLCKTYNFQDLNLMKDELKENRRRIYECALLFESDCCR